MCAVHCLFLKTQWTYLIASFLVPYQDNSWDCGVFVCRYAYGLYLLRNHVITYGDLGNSKRPFRELITNSEEFDFDSEDIVRLRGVLKILIGRLSTMYLKWKKAKDEQEKADAAKKPAACRRLLQETKENSTAGDEQGKTESENPSQLISQAAPDEPVAGPEESRSEAAPNDPMVGLEESVSQGTPDEPMVDVEASVSQATNDEPMVDIEESIGQAAYDEPMVDVEESMSQMVDVEESNSVATIKREEDQFGSACTV